MKRSRLYQVFSLLAFGVLAVSSFAQNSGLSSSSQASTGLTPFASFSGGPDLVNMGNLNVHMTIPILNKAGRGVPFNYNLSFDSDVYGVQSGAWTIVDKVGWSAGGQTGLGGGELTNQSTAVSCFDGDYPYTLFTSYSGFVYLDATGVSHSFPGATVTWATSSGGGPVGCGEVGGTWTYSGFPANASDNSGIILSASSTGAQNPQSSMPGGLTITLRGGLTASTSTSFYASIAALTGIEDMNGNQVTLSAASSSCPDLNGACLSYATYTDTLGQTALTTSLVTTAGASQVYSYSFQGGNGGTSQYQLHYTVSNLATAFGCAGVSEFITGSPLPHEEYPYDYGAVALPDHLYLPDGRQFSFTYEQTSGMTGYTTGRIASITFPAGGSVSYSYGPVNCADGTPLSLTRTLQDANGNTSMWTYSRTQSGSNWVTTVTDPLNNQQVLTFAAEAPPGSTIDNFYEVNRAEYSSSAASGTLMRTTTTSYNNNWATAPPITTRTVTSMLPNASSGKSSSITQTYDEYGTLTSTLTKDFGAVGAGAGSSILSTSTSYIAWDGAFDIPVANVLSGFASGNFPSMTLFNVGTGPAMTTTGATQHVTGLPNGNPGSISRTVNQSGAAPLTTSYTYYDTGMINTATDVNGAVTTYSYTQCDQGFPTGTSQTVQPSGITLTTSMSWNCVGGVPTSQTDVNGNTTTLAYNDPLWRITSSTDALGNTTTYSYPTATSNTSEVIEPFNGGSSVADVLTTYDGLGRPILVQKRQGPSVTTFDSVATQYDLLGRSYWTSLPYSAAAGVYKTTGPGVTKSYDALGRILSVTDAGGGSLNYAYNLNDVLITAGPAATGENTKRRSLEYDGAGRLTSVCEITLAAGSGSCGQSTANTGFLTQYGYDLYSLNSVKQNVQAGSGATQSRSMTYDWAGRKISEVIPETGTSAITYDSDSTGKCPGSYPGNVIKTVDNMGNTTCFTYDSLHRPLSSNVVSGTYASATPQNYFVYDAASLSGTAMQNAKGALAEAYTCTGSCSSKLTDIFVSKYPETSGGQNTGRSISQVWESTPNSNGYFLAQTTSHANGAPGGVSVSLNGTLIGFPNLVFGVDGMGRPTSATDTTNTLNLVTSTSYAPGSGAVTGVTLGNGDSDAFGYDSATNRPVSFSAVIGGSSAFSLAGTLTWNANGSLYNFTLTDASDSSKNQNCGYSMDDLNRLASVNCSGSWAQNFSYDSFGNISKGPPTNPGSGQITQSYAAGYSSVNNQVTSGVAATYDANGNQTLAETNNLSWNASAQAVTVNGIGATYDSLGRLVETAGGSTGPYTQYVYSPGGNKIAVVQNGQLVKGAVPLPGRGTAIYDGGGFNYFRHTDWLGSSRLATTWTHSVYSKEAYAPFGETYNEVGTPDRSFTGQDQDTAVGVFDFLFRRYDPVAGRWLSPDPKGWGAVSTDYPQSLNRYAYVQNDPMRLTDPDGQDCIYAGATLSETTVVPGDCYSDTDNGIFVDGHATFAGYADNGDYQFNISPYGPGNNPYDPDGSNLYNLAMGISGQAGPWLSPTGIGLFYGASLGGAILAGDAIVADAGVQSLGLESSGTAASAPSPIVLGLADPGAGLPTLQQTADALGGQTLMGSTDLMGDLSQAAATPGQCFAVCLNGVAGDGVENQVMNSVYRSMTPSGATPFNTEMGFLYQNQMLTSVSFYSTIGGILTELVNPF